MEPVPPALLRRAQRVSATIPVSLVVESGDSTVERDAYTVDLSRYGVRIRTAHALSPGEKIAIIPSGDSGQTIPGRVVWVQRGEFGRGSLAGLEFLSPLLT
jgi:hypothetical protein